MGGRYGVRARTARRTARSCRRLRCGRAVWGWLLAAAVVLAVGACDASNETDRFSTDPECFGLDGVGGEGVECGTVRVPLDHATPEGEQIELATVVVAGDEGVAGRSPVLVLGGGPGVPMVESALAAPQRLSIAGRETIVIDQRGVGLSDPALDCPGLGDVIEGTVATDLDVVGEAMAACRRRLVDDGVDLDAFTYRANALDVDLVRAALGYDQVDVFGRSYGAHLGLHAASLNPAGIRSLVLIAPVDPSRNVVAQTGPGVQAALERVDRACAASQSCAEQVDDVSAAISEVAARLAEEPDAVSPRGGDEITFTPAVFVDALFSLFYLRDGPAELPALVDQARDGELGPLADRYAEYQRGARFTMGLQAAMVCSADAAIFDAAAAREQVTFAPLRRHWLPATTLAGEGTVAVCEAMDVQPAYDPAEFTFPAGVPALVVTGEVDHVAPPDNGEAIAAALDTAHVIEVAGAGHRPLATVELFTGDDCRHQLIGDFLAEPDRRPDDTCTDHVLPLESVLEQQL